MMRYTMMGLAAALFASAAMAQTGASPPTPQGTAPITGQDVMGDKGRSGPDGWVFAPINRTDSPSGQSPSEQSGRTTRNDPTATGQAPHASTPMPAGQDPGTPDQARSSGPGSADVPRAQR